MSVFSDAQLDDVRIVSWGLEDGFQARSVG